MTARRRDDLKAFFRTGDVPTEDQFGDLIDSAVNKVEDGISAHGGSVYVGSPSVLRGALVIYGPTLPLQGTVATTAGSTAVVGTGTAFTTELRPGDLVCIDDGTYRTRSIDDDTHLTLAFPATLTISEQPIFSGPLLQIGDPYYKTGMTVAASGAVGVGTATPATTLEVRGTVTAKGFAGPISAAQLTGTLDSAQVPPIPASHITGTIGAGQVAPIPASQITGSLIVAQVSGLQDLLDRVMTLEAKVKSLSGSAPSEINGLGLNGTNTFVILSKNTTDQMSWLEMQGGQDPSPNQLIDLDDFTIEATVYPTGPNLYTPGTYMPVLTAMSEDGEIVNGVPVSSFTWFDSLLGFCLESGCVSFWAQTAEWHSGVPSNSQRTILTATTPLPADTWSRIAVRWKLFDQVVTLYVEGREVASATWKGPWVNQVYRFLIGTDAARSGYFTGRIRDLMVWRGQPPSLPTAHIPTDNQQLLNAAYQNGLGAYFPCDEGFLNSLIDYTPVGNNGTIYYPVW